MGKIYYISVAVVSTWGGVNGGWGLSVWCKVYIQIYSSIYTTVYVHYIFYCMYYIGISELGGGGASNLRMTDMANHPSNTSTNTDSTSFSTNTSISSTNLCLLDKQISNSSTGNTTTTTTTSSITATGLWNNLVECFKNLLVSGAIPSRYIKFECAVFAFNAIAIISSLLLRNAYGPLDNAGMCIYVYTYYILYILYTIYIIYTTHTVYTHYIHTILYKHIHYIHNYRVCM